MADLLIKKYYNEGLLYLNERADADIRKNRTGDFTVTVVDKNGKPAAGKEINLKHKTHDFDFGCNFFMYGQYDTYEENEYYEKEWKKLFNTAVIPLYWEGTEPIRDHLRYTADTPNDMYRRPNAESVVNWCEKNGVRKKGHPLFWHEFIPEWLPEDWKELYPLFEKRMREISGLFADRIPVFDCVNEPARIWNVEQEHKNDAWKHLVPPKDYIKEVFDLAEKYFPHNELILNEAVGASFTEFHGRYSAYYLNIKDLLSDKVRIDRIGLQCRTFESPMFRNVFDATRLYDVFDTYADFGKPLVLSETSIPSRFGGVKDEEFQAEAAVQLYKVCFSHKSVDGIFWWNLTDDGIAVTKRKASGENLPSQGLIDEDHREKPAYKAINRLINNEWRTNVTLTTDGDGKVRFNGFNGEYEAVISGKKQLIHLSSENGELSAVLKE